MAAERLGAKPPADMMTGTGDKSRKGIHKFLPSLEVADPKLQQHLSQVMEYAATGLSANVGIFLDVDGRCSSPWDCGYALTQIDPVGDDWAAAFDEVIDKAERYDFWFRVRIWVSQAVLAKDWFVITDVLAHELQHARQYETHEDLYLASLAYDRFLQERGCRLPQWHKPLEIDAELAAREIVRQLHGPDSLEELRKHFRQDEYEEVLRQERLGNFDAEKCFREIVLRGGTKFVQWQRQDPDARDNPWLRGVATDLKSRRQGS